jgi:DNA-binding response OmpR family regulator
LTSSRQIYPFSKTPLLLPTRLRQAFNPANTQNGICQALTPNRRALPGPANLNFALNSNAPLPSLPVPVYIACMKILIVEHDAEIADNICRHFKPHGFHCETAGSYAMATRKIAMYDYDCILLDIGIGADGFDVLRELRMQGKTDGVIVTTARDHLETRIESFNIGADDYLTKPFHLSELLARVQALIRRKKFNGHNTLRFNEIAIDVMAKTVTGNGFPVEVTKKEFNLLMLLIGNENKVLSKAAIAEYLSGDMADMLDHHDFVYAHIKNLKKKLGAAGIQDYISTVYGQGYKWESC